MRTLLSDFNSPIRPSLDIPFNDDDKITARREIHTVYVPDIGVATETEYIPF